MQCLLHRASLIFTSPIQSPIVIQLDTLPAFYGLTESNGQCSNLQYFNLNWVPNWIQNQSKFYFLGFRGYNLCTHLCFGNWWRDPQLQDAHRNHGGRHRHGVGLFQLHTQDTGHRWWGRWVDISTKTKSNTNINSHEKMSLIRILYWWRRRRIGLHPLLHCLCSCRCPKYDYPGRGGGPCQWQWWLPLHSDNGWHHHHRPWGTAG